MQLVFEIINTIGLTIGAFFKGLWDASPALLGLAEKIEEVKSIFSWEGVLQYGFGVPEIIVTVLSVLVAIVSLVRALYKKGIIGR